MLSLYHRTEKDVEYEDFLEHWQVLRKKLVELEIRGRIETIQTTALLRSARLPRKKPGDLRRLVAARILAKDHQLILA